MKMMNELIPLRLYPSKRKVFIPLNEDNKRKGSAIFLMGSSQESNEMMMQLSYLHQKQYYRSYYIDRKVMAYINSSEGIPSEEFDEIQENALSEAMFHNAKSKVEVINASTMNKRMITDAINDDSIKSYLSKFKFKDLEIKEVKVKVHPSLASLKEDMPEVYKNLGVLSYNTPDTIHVLADTVYGNQDGPYDLYLRNELICFIIFKAYGHINLKLVFAIAFALSGQLDWFKKEKNVTKFEPSDNGKYKINELYLGDIINTAYKAKGYKVIHRLLDGNMDDIRKYATRRVMLNVLDSYTEALLEGSLSTKERNDLSDKDFGIPSKRKYPMPDEDHVKSAIRFFNYCDKEDEEELASAIKRNMKKFNMKDVKIGKNNRFSKYVHETYITEIAYDSLKKYGIPGLEEDDDGNPIIGEHSKEYLDVLTVCDDLDTDEFNRISFNPTYADNKFVEKRIILYDVNEKPMCFMDVYHFPSSPTKAQITTAVARSYRGNHYCAKMLRELLDSNFAAEKGIKEYIWHVHPGNEASEKAAMSGGFTKENDDLDKYGRMTYRLRMTNESAVTEKNFRPEYGFSLKFSDDQTSAYLAPNINGIKNSEFSFHLDFDDDATSCMLVPDNPASDIIPVGGYDPDCKFSGMQLIKLKTAMDASLHEAAAMGNSNDTKFKKWLYRERMKNARALVPIYTAVKSRNPSIDRTFREVSLYKGLNLFVDTYYYHEMYLKNAYKGTKRSVYMYYDFFLRLMENDEIKSSYSKITYFIPVVYPDNASSIESLLDFKTSLNIYSVIMYMVRKDPIQLKKLANKEIIFLGKNGYFKVDFNNFNTKNLPRFKKDLTAILSGVVIPDEDDDEEEYETPNSTKAVAANVIERVSPAPDKDSKIKNISAIDTVNINHLKVSKTMPNLKSNKTAIFIVASTSEAVVNEIKDKSISVYYKPKG